MIQEICLADSGPGDLIRVRGKAFRALPTSPLRPQSRPAESGGSPSRGVRLPQGVAGGDPRRRSGPLDAGKPANHLTAFPSALNFRRQPRWMVPRWGMSTPGRAAPAPRPGAGRRGGVSPSSAPVQLGSSAAPKPSPKSQGRSSRGSHAPVGLRCANTTIPRCAEIANRHGARIVLYGIDSYVRWTSQRSRFCGRNDAVAAAVFSRCGAASSQACGSPAPRSARREECLSSAPAPGRLGLRSRYVGGREPRWLPRPSTMRGRRSSRLQALHAGRHSQLPPSAWTGLWRGRLARPASGRVPLLGACVIWSGAPRFPPRGV